MKITFVTADMTSFGGIERVNSVLSDTFVRHGLEVEIISLYRNFPDLSYALNKNVSLTFLSEKKYASSKPGGLSRLSMHIGILLKLKKELKKHKADILICQAFPVSFLVWLAGYAKNGIACEHTHYNQYGRVLKKIRTAVYKDFKKTVVLTMNDKNRFDHDKVSAECIPNPISFCNPRKSDLSVKRILCVGRLTPQKGYDLLLPILPDVFSKHPDWRLDIFGDGPDKEKLCILRDSLGLNEYVEFRGTTKDIASEYVSSSLFVLSSRWEGFGMVLIEAASCGLPIISFNCPEGPADILENDRGVLVKNGDVESLKSAILWMLDSEESRKYYSRKSSEIVEEYQPEIIFKKWDRLFSCFNL